MEKDSRNPGNSNENWKRSDAESDSGRDEKDKKSKKKSIFRMPLGAGADAERANDSTDESSGTKPDKSAAVDAWKRLVAKNTENPAIESSKDADQAKSVDSHDDEAVADKTMDFPLEAVAESSEPPASPPPAESWLRGPELALEGAGSRWSAETTDDDFESRAANAPLSGPEAPVDDGEAESVPRPTPEADPELELIAQDMPLPNVEKASKIEDLPADRRPAEIVTDKQKQSRNGYERTTADVQRAAWSGVIFGWLVGRRGKKKAVERAAANAQADAARRYQQTLRTESYNTASSHPEAPAAPTTTAEQPRTPAEWLKPENSSAAARRMSSEHLASTPLADILAVPAAVVASRMLIERRNARQEAAIDETQLIQLAKTIRVDGIPLHKIYESKQIDKGGLRAVVAAYLRGESVEKHLTKQIIEKQRSFERDPRQRYRDGFRSAVGKASGALVATGIGLAQGSQRVASKVGRSVVDNVSSRTGANRSDSSAPKPAKIVQSRESTNWISIVAIVIIYGLILLLWFTRPR